MRLIPISRRVQRYNSLQVWRKYFDAHAFSFLRIHVWVNIWMFFLVLLWCTCLERPHFMTCNQHSLTVCHHSCFTSNSISCTWFLISAAVIPTMHKKHRLWLFYDIISSSCVTLSFVLIIIWFWDCLWPTNNNIIEFIIGIKFLCHVLNARHPWASSPKGVSD